MTADIDADKTEAERFFETFEDGIDGRAIGGFAAIEVGGENFDAAFAAGDANANFGGKKIEFNGAGFGFEDRAVFVADGLAFLSELRPVLLAIAEDGDEAARSGEKAIDGPRGEDGAFA